MESKFTYPNQMWLWITYTDLHKYMLTRYRTYYFFSEGSAVIRSKMMDIGIHYFWDPKSAFSIWKHWKFCHHSATSKGTTWKLLFWKQHEKLRKWVIAHLAGKTNSISTGGVCNVHTLHSYSAEIFPPYFVIWKKKCQHILGLEMI